MTTNSDCDSHNCEVGLILQCLRDITGAEPLYVPMGGSIETGIRGAIWMDDAKPSSRHVVVLYDCESQDDGDIACDVMKRLSGYIPTQSKAAVSLKSLPVGGIVCGLWYRVYEVVKEGP